MGSDRIPVPTDVVQKIHARLAPHYGNEVWSDASHKVLLIRVPRPEPDPVNDVEDAVDFLTPGDVDGITHCVLLGHRRLHLVYPGPVQNLMAERQRFDHGQVAQLRERLIPGAHHLFRAPEDPRRKWRLGVRLPKESVRELEDEDLEQLAETIGPELESGPMQKACAVYLVATRDFVRLEPEMFIQELLRTWNDEERKRRIEADRRRADDEARRAANMERQRLLRDLDSKFHHAPRVAKAKVRSKAENRVTLAENRVLQAESRVQAEATTRGRPLLEDEAEIVASEPPPETGPARRPAHLHETSGPRREGDALDALHHRLDALQGRTRRAPAGRSGNGSDRLRARAYTPGVTTGRRRPRMDDETRAVTVADPDGPILPPAFQDVASNATPRMSDGSDSGGQAVVDQTGGASGAGPDGWTVGGPPAGAATESTGAQGASTLPDGAETQAAGPGGMTQGQPDGMTVQLGRDPRHDLGWERDAPVAAGPKQRLADALRSQGYAVVLDPPVEPPIDLAAERTGHPGRVVVRFLEHLNLPWADQLLRQARDLAVDRFVIVAPDADEGGKRKIVASKLVWVRPDELDRLDFARA